MTSWGRWPDRVIDEPSITLANIEKFRVEVFRIGERKNADQVIFLTVSSLYSFASGTPRASRM